MKNSLSLILILNGVLLYPVNAQTEIANAMSTKISNDLIVVNYDIINSAPGQPFLAEPKYFSKQYKALNPQNVTGDISKATVGEGKKFCGITLMPASGCYFTNLLVFFRI